MKKKKTRRAENTAEIPAGGPSQGAVTRGAGGVSGGFTGRPWLPAAALAAYIFLLALGAAGEFFHVRWILNLPIFKGP